MKTSATLQYLHDNPNTFVDEQKRLLTLERAEEINQSKVISESPPKVLEEKNLCIRKLRVANIFTGLYGRTIIEFESKIKSDDSSKRVFTQGDIVGVCNDSGKNDISKSIATGLFYKLTKDYIQIALDNDLDESSEFRDTDETVFRLVKLSSEVTYQRLKAGLKYLEKRSNPLCGDYLIDLLMGNGNLRTSDPQRGNTLASLVVNALTFHVDITYFNENLNDSQKDAVKFAISRPDIAIVHGPPGTGKTTVAVEIISQILATPSGHKMPKILVCTPSNIALDNLAEKLLKVPFAGKTEKGKSTAGRRVNVLRLGHSARVMSHLSDISIDHRLSICDQAELIGQVRSQIDWTLKQSFQKNGKRLDKRRELGDLRKELREREMKAVREVLSSSQVIMSTLTGLRSNKSLPLNEIEFDVVIIDEVSQAIEAACWLAIPRGKKLILAGDHKQLPPTVLSAEAVKAGLGRSLMERLLDVFPAQETTRMLTCQYRMHEHIMQWSSDTFYSSSLLAHSSVARHLLSDICTDHDPAMDPLPALVFIDTASCDLLELDSSQEDSKANLGEAHLAAVYIKQLVQRFKLCPDQIGVITPYSRQVQLVKQCLRDKVTFDSDFDVSQLEISTVDGFQGREKEVIVTTLVRSNMSGTVGFLSETRRLNVALTRSKRHLCIIGDSGTISQSRDTTLRSLLDYWHRVAESRSAHDYIYDNDIHSGDSVRPSKPTAKTKFQQSNNREKSDTNEMEKKVCEQLRKFNLSASATTLQFSAELNPRLRAILHELSEELHLNHVSVGEGASRKLIVSKPDMDKERQKSLKGTDKIAEGNELVNEEIEKNVEKTVDNKEDMVGNYNKEEKCIEEKLMGKDEVTECDKDKEEECIKEKMVRNMDEKVTNTVETIGDDFMVLSKILKEKSEHLEKLIKDNGAISKKVYQPTTNKKKSPKEKVVVEEISDDFDTMMEQFQRMNKVCQHPMKCTTPVAVLGFDCRFCKLRFCSSHTQPEVHNCPRITTQAWRADSETKRPMSRKEEVRHVQLSRAVTRKIDGMAQERRTGHNAKNK